jgi:hypothetical protein
VIIGRPNSIEAFQPLNPEEFAYLRQPIDAALAQGVPLEQQVGVDLVVLCRLLKTVLAISAEVQRLASTQAEQPAPIASLAPETTDPVVSTSAAEEPPLPFLTGTPVALTEG